MAVNSKSYKIDEARTILLQGVPKLDSQNGRHVTNKIETKLYEVDNYVENILVQLIIHVSAESSLEGSDYDSV